MKICSCVSILFNCKLDILVYVGLVEQTKQLLHRHRRRLQHQVGRVEPLGGQQAADVIQHILYSSNFSSQLHAAAATSQVFTTKCVSLFRAGIYSQEVLHHAVSDWVWDPGRGHDHCPAAQQPQAAGETHHSQRDRDLRQPAEAQQGAQVGRVHLPQMRWPKETI